MQAGPYLDRLSKRRVQNATGWQGTQPLREYIAADTRPNRSLLGLIASLPIRAYRVLSYRHEFCSFRRGLNCSTVVLKSFGRYGVASGLAVMYLLLLAPKSTIGDCDCNHSEKQLSGWCD